MSQAERETRLRAKVAMYREIAKTRALLRCEAKPYAEAERELLKIVNRRAGAAIAKLQAEPKDEATIAAATADIVSFLDDIDARDERGDAVRAADMASLVSE